MSGGFYGADVEQLRQLANTMRTAGRKLDAQRLALNGGVAGTPWPGPDAEVFRQEWKSVHSRSLGAAATLLQQTAQDLLRHADEQQSASTAGSASAMPPLPGTVRSPAPQPEDLEGISPAEAKTWWLGLTSDQQQAFIRNYPGLAGNTNGIPFEARIEANRHNAQDRIDWLKNNDPEPQLNYWILDSSYPARFAAEHEEWRERQEGIGYLQKVVDGKVQLAAYDPGNQSIVELIGTYDENTTTVITYVPGTLSNEASFYDGRGPQAIPGHLVKADTSGGTAAFVYKGSEFPDGGPVEAFLIEAKNDEFVAASAPVLAAFQKAVSLELPPQAQTVGIGHSWGARNLTGSEMEGASYSKVLALSGAAMPPGWTPTPGTDYASYTYPDILLTAEVNGLVGENYPMREPAFEKHIYAPPGGLRPAEMYSIDNHSLIAKTVPENEKALDDIEEKISGR
ncbi:hypothetical protein [Arthrobacter sp. ZGTC412]|uniref:hypothetical protein n=1 Tax=Arthrobacter sp. ZGTC412 TaxID=2058900 RepID=UPI000CE47E05|nr:hypothetical protein [Arthrobacter sp. ZGTC412]